MNDLHIIQKPNQKDSPYIFASEKRRLLKIHKWYSFDETTWNLLVDWIQEYQSRNEALLTYEGFIDLPDNLEYKYFGKRSHFQSSQKASKFVVSNLFGEILKDFNFYSKGGNYPTKPTFTGDFSDDFIKISGESYSSYTWEIFIPFFNWIEIYLQTNPKKIRVEIWLTYFNTSASRRVWDLFTALNLYKKNANSKIELFWYVEEGDTDMIESVGEFKEDESSLEIVILDKEVV
ncbi:MAG: hypothetical protein ACI81T_002877 [Bacteroidia bacterium]|jgi:hypothetical protein